MHKKKFKSLNIKQVRKAHYLQSMPNFWFLEVFLNNQLLTIISKL